MPEEINRILTDAIADILWTPSQDADENLRHEGVAEERISRVGNIMMDAYEILRSKIEASSIREQLGLKAKSYGVVTLHRPSNVDNAATLAGLVEALSGIAREMPLVFPLHPRTKRNLAAFHLLEPLSAALNVQLREPLSYIPFMALVRESALVITDSGGIQEETTYLGIPCITLRDSTERPITIAQGTNRLADAGCLASLVQDAIHRGGTPAVRPPLWDGQTAGRVIADIERRLAHSPPT
jgi:UDP-N-acetylglucosamine 2-epimerase (non-hydrolysing)